MTARPLNLCLALALLLALPLALLAGPVWIPFVQWFGGDLRALIIAELRLPRVVLGLAIGAALGLAGAVMQGFLRNPLADPGLFGISATAALGAVASIFFGYGGSAISLPLFALGGAAGGMALLTLLAGRDPGIVLFTLAGVMVASLAASLTALLISLAPSPFAVTQIVTWLMGALTDRSWSDVAFALPLIAAGSVVLASTGRALDALTLGESAARSLGVDPVRLQWQVVIGVGLCVGAAVAAAGVIGFVGLMVPHLVRRAAGGRPSAVLLPSALGGALLLVVADAVVRTLPTAAELRLGIAMSLLGAPFFLALLWRVRRETT